MATSDHSIGPGYLVTIKAAHTVRNHRWVDTSHYETLGRAFKTVQILKDQGYEAGIIWSAGID